MERELLFRRVLMYFQQKSVGMTLQSQRGPADQIPFQHVCRLRDSDSCFFFTFPLSSRTMTVLSRCIEIISTRDDVITYTQSPELAQILRDALLGYQRVAYSDDYFSSVSIALFNVLEAEDRAESFLRGDTELLQILLRILNVEEANDIDCLQSMWGLMKAILQQTDESDHKFSQAFLEWISNHQQKLCDALARIKTALSDEREIKSVVSGLISELQSRLPFACNILLQFEHKLG